MKTTRRLFAVVSSLVVAVTATRADTIVPGGLIEVDTVWTAGGSPYILDGDVLVPGGVTLQIDEGVEVHLEVHDLMVSGTVLAMGSSEAPVRLVGPGGLYFTDSAPPSSQVLHCRFDNARLVALGHLPLLEFCTFDGPDSSLEMRNDGDHSDVTIRDCTFNGNTNLNLKRVAMLTFERNVSARKLNIDDAQHLHVVDSTFERANALVGTLDLEYSWASGLIHGNRFVGELLYLETFTGEISDNSFSLRGIVSRGGGASWYQNEFAFDVTGDIPGDVGMRVYEPDPGMVLNDNNFGIIGTLPDDQGLLQAISGSGIVIDAERNWWGSADATTIENLIIHFLDAANRPFVDFVPFRIEPVGLCDIDADCPDDLVFCNGSTICVGGVCEPAGDPCAPDEFCNESTAACNECQNDGHCDNGRFCDGDETCVGGACESGGPPICDDGVSCTVDDCDEEGDSCVYDGDDESCSNGEFCDGAEVCDPIGGCGPGAPVVCDDGVACTDDSCDEGADTCVNAPDHSACSNDLYCDGDEQCDPSFGCLSGSPPDCDDGVDCTIDSCDEEADTCANVPDNSYCDDGWFCTGAETCDLHDGCLLGVYPCGDLLCDDDTDSCTDCLFDPDEDGVCDDDDNCPFEANVKQLDGDEDGAGDVCDNCRDVPNPDQDDSDFDSIGDACDNCVDVPNVPQGDADDDGVGDACDACPAYDDNADDDNDGVANGCDLCPGGDDNQDADLDGVADQCDPCPIDNPDDSDLDTVCDSDDICSGFDDLLDFDGDQLPDDCDNCPDDANERQEDFDEDGDGDACDGDIDDDGVLNGLDVCDFTPAGAAVNEGGTLDSDLDGDCDVDLDDWKVMQVEFTGPNPP